jgi:hypothetical protein
VALRNERLGESPSQASVMQSHPAQIPGYRGALVVERQQAAEALADLKVKVERGGVQVRASIAESGAMPLRYAAEVIGAGGDSEEAIRRLMALMVLCCDPFTAAASAPRSTIKPHWSAVPLHSCRADASEGHSGRANFCLMQRRITRSARQ